MLTFNVTLDTNLNALIYTNLTTKSGIISF